MPRKTIPWKLEVYGPGGALSEKDVDDLAAEFDLPRDFIHALSLALAPSLNPSKGPPRSIVQSWNRMQRAPREVSALIAELGQATGGLMKANARLKNLQTLSLEDEQEMRIETMRPLLTQAQKLTAAVAAMLRISIRREQKFTYNGPPDKRRLYDYRRRMVLQSVFDCWSKAGRKVSITTDPLTSKRTGALVRFTNAVTRRITDPASEVDGEMIRAEIKFWHKRRSIY